MPRSLPSWERMALCLALASTRSLAASPSPHPIEIAYSAHDGCPDLSDFLEQVRQRTESAISIEPADPSHRYRISIVRDDDLSRGELELGDEAQHRRVEARDCAAVVEALALIVAVSAERNVSPSEPLSASPIPFPEPEPAAPQTRSVVFGFDALVSEGPAPQALLGASAWGQIDPVPRPRWTRPSVRLSGSWQTTGALSVGSGGARFALARALLEACPLGWGDANAIHLRACAHLELGWISAEGLERGQVVEARSATDLWTALGLGAVLRAPLLGPWFIEADLRLTLPLVPRAYYFENPREMVHQSWLLSPSAAVGTGLRFP